MPMQQLIYASRPSGYSTSVLDAILATSRKNNLEYDITGALVCRKDVFVQLLEGPVGSVEALFSNICKDDRHTDVTVLVRSHVVDRLFESWAMKCDPARSWLWNQNEIQQDVHKRATAREVREVFLRVASYLES